MLKTRYSSISSNIVMVSSSMISTRIFIVILVSLSLTISSISVISITSLFGRSFSFASISFIVKLLSSLLFFARTTWSWMILLGTTSLLLLCKIILKVGICWRIVLFLYLLIFMFLKFLFCHTTLSSATSKTSWSPFKSCST